MEFTPEMFVDLAHKAGLLVAYALVIAIVWWALERIVGTFRRGKS